MTIPQLWIMRIDKPAVDMDEDEEVKPSINSAESFLAHINKK